MPRSGRCSGEARVLAGPRRHSAWTPPTRSRSLGARLERRGHQRRLGTAPRETSLRRPCRGAPPRRFSRARASGDVATAGRWSLAGRLFGRRHRAGRRRGSPRPRRAAARAAGDRHPRRRACRGIPGGYGAVYGELRALETVGACRRGYFVEGLGGAQFALPGAVERLRKLRGSDADADCPTRGAGRRRPGPALRRRAPVATARRSARGARRRGARRAARRGGGAVRRPRWPLAPSASRSRPRLAPPSARRARRLGEGRARRAPFGRALRRRAGGRGRRPAAARRGGVPGRPASRRAP